jgi:hypothetical protein
MNTDHPSDQFFLELPVHKREPFYMALSERKSDSGAEFRLNYPDFTSDIKWCLESWLELLKETNNIFVGYKKFLKRLEQTDTGHLILLDSSNTEHKIPITIHNTIVRVPSLQEWRQVKSVLDTMKTTEADPQDPSEDPSPSPLKTQSLIVPFSTSFQLSASWDESQIQKLDDQNSVSDFENYEPKILSGGQNVAVHPDPGMCSTNQTSGDD